VKIYEIKTEKDKTYFLRMWNCDQFAHGYKFVLKAGRWSTYKARYYFADLRNYPDKFPVVCIMSVDELRQPILRAITDAKYANNNI